MPVFRTVSCLAATAVIAAAGAGYAAGVFTLITKEDFAAEQRFEALPENARARDLVAPPQDPSLPPWITVISPHAGAAAIASPLRIELAFDTSPDAHILPDSLRVRYGLLKIDVTQKIRPYAMLTDKGLVAENAAIPPGSHRLLLQIKDSAGRTKESQLQFTVAE